MKNRYFFQNATKRKQDGGIAIYRMVLLALLIISLALMPHLPVQAMPDDPIDLKIFDNNNETVDIKIEENDLNREEIDLDREENDLNREENDLDREEIDLDREDVDLDKEEIDLDREGMALDADDPLKNIDDGLTLPLKSLAKQVLTIDETIDLSESGNTVNTALGYEIVGTQAPYSLLKPIIGEQPLPAIYTDGKLTFDLNAGNKTFRISQSGVRKDPVLGLTKNGTAIITEIVIQPNVGNITLIIEDIDLGTFAANNVWGSICVESGVDLTLLLGEDTVSGTDGSYIQNSIRLHPKSSLTIDSASDPGNFSTKGALTVTSRFGYNAPIGGNDYTGLNSGAIIINGGTVTAINDSLTSTGAAIGGGGASTVGSSAGAGNITINGGIVTAISNGRGAAIGGGGVRAYNSIAGNGNVTINGGIVNATNTQYGAAIGGGAALDTDNGGGGGSARGGGGVILIAGGTVTATGNKGAGIGGGLVGLGGSMLSRLITIESNADVKAYSSGVDITSPYPVSARLALDADSLGKSCDYFVNARFNTVIPGNVVATLQVRANGTGTVLDTLTLPANYRCFAYNTSGSRIDNIRAYNASTSLLLGGVSHDDADSSLEIFSINTWGGYGVHGSDILLPVKLTSVPNRYLVYRDLYPTTLVNSYHWLADAVNACQDYASYGSYTIVATEDDYDVTGGIVTAVSIPNNKRITLKSNEYGIYSIYQPNYARHLNLAGQLILKNIILDGADKGGGVTVGGSGSKLIMNNGSVIKNCNSGSKGGAVYISDGGKLEMNGGSSISDNKATSGGGVYIMAASAPASTSFSLNGGSISRNSAGGGSRSSAGSNGGGIYAEGGNAATLELNSGEFSQNKAPSGHGGAIYTTDLAYTNLFIASSVVFSDNTASIGIDLAKTAEQLMAMLPSIQTDSHSSHSSLTFVHPLNNYDINVNTHKVSVYYVDESDNFIVLPEYKDYYVLKGFPFELAEPEIPEIEEHIYLGWKIELSGSVTDKKNPVIVDNLIGDTNIYLIYGQETTLTVSKEVAGDHANKHRFFTFTIFFFADSEGLIPLDSGTKFHYTGDSFITDVEPPEDGILELDSDGAATFILKHGQSITIKDLPTSIFCQIIEADDLNYETSFVDTPSGEHSKNHETGILTLSDLPRHIAYTNTRHTVVPSGVAFEDTKVILLPILLILLVLLLIITKTACTRIRR